jgi:hypothetical protein
MTLFWGDFIMQKDSRSVMVGHVVRLVHKLNENNNMTSR